MLPAKSQKVPSAAATVETNSPQAVGFAKVLTSIQGLQQRLNDFSIEDVARAEANAENLIRQLSRIQLKLTGLPLIKRAFIDAQRLMPSLAEENFELVSLSPLDKYSNLNALLTIAGRLHQAVRACPETPPEERTAPQAGADPIARAAAPTSAEWMWGDIEPARVDSMDSAPVFKSASQHTAANQPAKASEIHNPGKSTFDQRLLDDLIKSYGDFASFSGPTIASDEALNSASLGAPNSQLVEAPPDSRSADVEIRSLTTGWPQAEVKPALPPPETPAEIIRVIETEEPKTAPQSGTSLTRHGEIDRQLKSIIKDYGEYDLYSHRSSLKTKVAAIVAFALLGLVMVGFYFLKTPAGTTVHPPHATVPSSGATTITTGQPANSATSEARETK